ncbi:HNH endonuclease [Natronosalvus rutilus]|uniref:HNH endonuclease n=1 Tax=Natronosalvus rutilus TaxID=2953753 RepID=A0A9E7SUS1_9EURY|nr:HNH endonuclease [Natronosalvus rutilus]UTF52271.1 HNH endonuclease [Natronosalvus rutilus]
MLYDDAIITRLEGEALHAMEDLITLCEGCHSWFHKKPTGDELPLGLSDGDRRALLPHDYLILRVLVESGPCSMSDLQEAMAVIVSPSTVRERTWRLMGLDYEVFSRDQPLVDQDTVTGNWGLATQVSTSERGRIPNDVKSVVQRVHDELVRQALACGCDRATVKDVFGIARRTTWNKQYRAQAYDFPIGAFEQGTTVSTGQAAAIERNVNEDSMSADTQSLDLGEPDEVWPPSMAGDTGSEEVMAEGSDETA